MPEPSAEQHKPSVIINPFFIGWKNVSLALLFGTTIIAAGLAGYYYFQLKGVKAPPSSSPPKTATSSAQKDETANWKTYENVKFGYSFKYPNDWFGPTSPDSESRLQEFHNIDKINPANPPEDFVNLEVFVWPKDHPDYSYQLSSFDKWKGQKVGYKEGNSTKMNDSDVLGFPSVRTHFETTNSVSNSLSIKHPNYILAFGFKTRGKFIETNQKIFDQILSTFRFD